MFDQIVTLVKQNAGTAIFNNPAIPNERNDEAVHETSNSIIGSLKNMISSGNISDILKMFSGQHEASNNPVTNHISGNLIQNLMSKFGLDHVAASGIAGNLVPDVMKNLVNKTNDPADSSFDIQGIFNHLSGGTASGFNVQSLLDKFKGGGGEGHSGLQDLMQNITGGSTNSGGGIMDKIKGMFN